MSETHSYLTPDYYVDFVCKGGSCRHPCCVGWGISLSMKEYFRLLGMDCSAELRRRMDGAFHLADAPTEEGYAQITPNWQGDCPMHLPNGYCQLQCECGETALPAICRYYPRGVHVEIDPECSCSNSCEGVLELLFQKREPIGFQRRDMRFDLPEAEADVPDRVRNHYRATRDLCIRTLQCRELPLSRRMMALGKRMKVLHRAFQDGADKAIAAALEQCARMEPPLPPQADDAFALRVQYRIAELFGRHSNSIHDYVRFAEQALALKEGEAPSADSVRRYREAKEHFSALFPEWPRMFEQVVVNHVFFERFPFSDRHENMWDEYLSLCAGYGLLRFLAVSWMSDKSDEADLVDVCAATFRLIDHSSFDWNAAVLLEWMHLVDEEDMARLLLA